MSQVDQKLLDEFKALSVKGVRAEELCILAMERKFTTLEQFRILGFACALSFEEVKELRLKVNDVQNLDEHYKNILEELDKALDDR